SPSRYVITPENGRTLNRERLPDPDSTTARASYLGKWTAWNHVRTAAALAAAASLTISLCCWRRGGGMEDSTMSPQRPEDWPLLFEQHLNAGDLDAVVALYEPDARFVPRSGDTIVGRDGIRQVLAGSIRTKTRLHSRVIKAVAVGDVALLY